MKKQEQQRLSINVKLIKTFDVKLKGMTPMATIADHAVQVIDQEGTCIGAVMICQDEYCGIKGLELHCYVEGETWYLSLEELWNVFDRVRYDMKSRVTQ
ncbi:hypothetical protein JXQ70_13025 [bacterium]|nr:hypothetical protein [bacterium]